jgi:hypothetical protein
MTLYSHKNQYPQPIPNRIRLPNGFTRTDSSTFTPEELTAAEYTGPYTLPEYDSKTETFDWTGTEFVVRPYNSQEIEDQWKIIREKRDQLLKDSDWTQITDYPFEIPNVEQWTEYRQTLRDLPETESNPFDIQFPPQP